MELLRYTVSLPGGTEQWNYYGTLPHYLGAVGGGTPAVHYHMLGGNGQWDSFSTLPHCLGLVGSGTCALHCHTAKEQWMVGLFVWDHFWWLQPTAR